MPGYDSTARLPFATGGRVGAQEGKYISKKTKWITKKQKPKALGKPKESPIDQKRRNQRIQEQLKPKAWITKKAEGARIGLKKGTDKNWIQKVDASIKRRGTKGKCTPITKPGCSGRAKALAKTFKKMAAKRKKS